VNPEWVWEKFSHLSPNAQSRVLALIEAEAMEAPAFDFANWWAQVDTLQQSLHARLGADGTIDGVGLLQQLREE
jgi:1,6-anhydro-N-acetylmuramate kinase